MSERSKPAWYALNHDKVGIGGIVSRKPRWRKRDRSAKPTEAYAVVFFPRITEIGKADLASQRTRETLAQTPETAIAKFMDSIWREEKWETYHKAGHRVRRIRLVDLGDA